MPHVQDTVPQGRKLLTARRLTLLATVAGLGVAVLLTGPGGFNSSNIPALSSSAHAAETATAQPFSFADLVARVKPAVISVRVNIQQTANTSDDDDGQMQPQGQPFQKFFRQFGNAPQGAPRHYAITGEGSGFFISADGYVVTNYHVVDHASTVEITTEDGMKYPAKVVGTDPRSDLALIKVDGSKDFTYVKFADHQPRIGDWVVAVGNPFGLGGTVTAGIVSAQGRELSTSPYDDYMQIDAPINKGNSGGPTFDVNGNVVGVNTAIYSPTGGSVGIGFDIPAETVKTVVAQLKDKGSVARGWMGVHVQPVTQGIAESLGMKTTTGALVDEPQAGSPAAKAGIEPGDIITAINGTAVKDARDLARKIGTMQPGVPVKFSVLRKGETKTVELTLGTLPNEQQAKADAGRSHQEQSGAAAVPHLGLTLAPAKDVAGSGDTGVVVMGVESRRPGGQSRL